MRMRRLSPPAGCGGCSVRGKPGRCLQDSISTNRGTRVRHHPRPRPTARSRFSSRSGSGPSGRRRRARGARLALHGPAWREGARAWTHQKSQGLTYENREFSAQMNPSPVYRAPRDSIQQPTIVRFVEYYAVAAMSSGLFLCHAQICCRPVRAAHPLTSLLCLPLPLRGPPPPHAPCPHKIAVILPRQYRRRLC